MISWSQFVAASLLACGVFNAHSISAAPTVTVITPAPDSQAGVLTSVSITFSEPVASVDPVDLFINGETTQAVSGTGAGPYTFTFTQPAPGLVGIEFAGDHGIAAVEGSGLFVPPDSWSYTLADVQAPATTVVAPAPGATVGTLSQAVVSFSEVVTGVDAADFTINGVAATSVSGFGAGPYTFAFVQPAAGAVGFGWDPGNGIVDLIGNAFLGSGWNVTRSAAGAGSLVITEFAAINASAFLDENGDNEAWIEIHNPGATAVNLNGWALTDDAGVPGKWTFPNRSLAAGSYLVVFASGKDRRPIAGELHTNFKLGTAGGYLALVKPDQPVVKASEFSGYPAQRAGYGFGLSGGPPRYFAPPTPGAANSATVLSAVAAVPQPGTARGYFTSSFQLTLTSGTGGASIRYTTNGSEPTATTGTLYTGAIPISVTTVIRAAAFATNFVPSPTMTHSYVFPAQVIDQPNNPPGFPGNWGTNTNFPGGTVTADYGMDKDPLRVNPNNSGSALDPVKVQRFDDGLRQLPWLSIAIPNSDLFASTGMYHSNHVQNKNFPDKPCSVEMVLPDGTTAFATTTGLGVHGNASREPQKNPKHGFGLKFKPEFGPAKLEYRLFPESAVTDYDDIIIRAEFGTSWRHWSDSSNNFNGAFQRSRSTGIRDQWVKDTMLEMGGLASHSRLVHLYLNGLYFGVYDLTEDPSASFGENFLGGKKEDYDEYDQGVLKGGTATVYTAMTSLPSANLNSTYEQFKGYLDIPSFIDYMLLHFYIGHQDWGLNKNWSALRQRAGGTFTTEGKFRYIPWDAENILLDTTVSRVPNAGGSTDVPGGLHTKLDNNAQYRLDFADGAHRHLIAPGGSLTQARNTARWQKWQTVLDNPIVAESCRWGDYRRDVHPYLDGSYPLYTRESQWLTECSRIVNTYFPTRATIILEQLRTANLYPTLNAPVFTAGAGGSVVGSGQVTPGYQLAMALPAAVSGTTSAGTIYYTTDGSDPRVIYGGTLDPGAQTYTMPLTLNAATLVKARVLHAGVWSALNEALFTTDSALPPVRITELMYNPPAGEEFEFVEIQNTGTLAIDLNGWSFTGISYVFPPGSVVAPGSRMVIASNDNPAGWRVKYPGVTPFAYFGGSLSNGGETIALLNAAGVAVSSVTYDDVLPWPLSPDGSGNSLEIADATGDPDDPTFWQASAVPGGTPGTPNSLPAPPLITGQPQDLTVQQGGSAAFTAVASGKALRYQWLFGPADITGATTSGHSINPVLPAHDGFYRCIVSNPGGSATTDPAALVVTRTFAQWLAATDLTGPATAADADPDFDGISNIAEFYHNLDPEIPASANDRAALPVIATTSISGATSLTFVYRQNVRALLTPPVFETTPTLTGPWSPVTPSSIEILTPDPVTGDPRVRATFQSPAGVGKAFYRMRFNP